MVDALIVTGTMTGVRSDPRDVLEVKGAVPEAKVLIGSGIDLSNVTDFLRVAEGGNRWNVLQGRRVVQNRVDLCRIRKLMKKVKELRKYSR